MSARARDQMRMTEVFAQPRTEIDESLDEMPGFLRMSLWNAGRGLAEIGCYSQCRFWASPIGGAASQYVGIL